VIYASGTPERRSQSVVFGPTLPAVHWAGAGSSPASERPARRLRRAGLPPTARVLTTPLAPPWSTTWTDRWVGISNCLAYSGGRNLWPPSRTFNWPPEGPPSFSARSTCAEPISSVSELRFPSPSDVCPRVSPLPMLPALVLSCSPGASGGFPFRHVAPLGHLRSGSSGSSALTALARPRRPCLLPRL